MPLTSRLAPGLAAYTPTPVAVTNRALLTATEPLAVVGLRVLPTSAGAVTPTDDLTDPVTSRAAPGEGVMMPTMGDDPPVT